MLIRHHLSNNHNLIKQAMEYCDSNKSSYSPGVFFCVIQLIKAREDGCSESGNRIPHYEALLLSRLENLKNAEERKRKSDTD